jgi:hypothetical protein
MKVVMGTISTAQFESALKTIPMPSGRQIEFLRVHYDAPGRALTATKLAEAVGYKDYRGVNLWYGRLADKIGAALGQIDPHLYLLVDFVPPNAATNKEWIFVMRPEFADALKNVGWL